MTVNPKSTLGRGKSHKCFKICDEYCYSSFRFRFRFPVSAVQTMDCGAKSESEKKYIYKEGEGAHIFSFLFFFFFFSAPSSQFECLEQAKLSCFALLNSCFTFPEDLSRRQHPNQICYLFQIAYIYHLFVSKCLLATDCHISIFNALA